MSGTQPVRTLGSSARSTWIRRHTRLGLLLGGAAVIAAVLIVFYRGAPKPAVKPLQTAAQVPAIYEPPAAEAPPIVRASLKPPPPIVTPPATPAVVAPVAPAVQTPVISVTSFRRPSGQGPAYMQPKQAAAVQADDSASGIAYKGEAFDGTSAFQLRHPTLVLPQWTTIPCVLETAVITGVSGVNPFRCRLPQDVKSPEGVVLMEQGTIVGGTYQSLVAEGQERIVAVTANARTPNNVVVPLGGPIADDIGAAGSEGTVNNHWWRRIGPALLLSFLDAGTSIGSTALQGNGNTNINLGGTLQGGPFSEVTRSLLESQMKIAPTITLKQGTVVQLWTTRWIDFSKVYALDSVR